jgi:hypothetical protein
MKKTAILVFVVFCVVPLGSLWSNDDATAILSAMDRGIGKPIKVETLQGGSFQGILKAISDDRIEIVADDGQILQVDLASIEEYVIIDEEVTKETFFQDSASNRLVVMPTGFPMETGEFHVADQEIIAVTVSYGLSEHVSFWSGVSIPGFVFSGRYTVAPTDRFSLSLGSFAGVLWMEVPLSAAILPYAVASWGEPNNNFTLAVSPIMTLDFNRESVFELSGAVLALGGKLVLTAASSLIFENWIVWTKREVYNDSFELEHRRWDAVPWLLAPAIVFRIAGQRLSWDIGAVLPLFIYDSEDVFIEEGAEIDGPDYNRNVSYRLGGFGRDVIFPLPIISVTYRID